jgi:hypothetical protein
MRWFPPPSHTQTSIIQCDQLLGMTSGGVVLPLADRSKQTSFFPLGIPGTRSSTFVLPSSSAQVALHRCPVWISPWRRIRSTASGAATTKRNGESSAANDGHAKTERLPKNTNKAHNQKRTNPSSHASIKAREIVTVGGIMSGPVRPSAAWVRASTNSWRVNQRTSSISTG